MECKDCAYFKRLRFHKIIDPKEGEQKGGNCKLLKEVLGMTNSLHYLDHIHVNESFGCTFFRERR